MLTNKRKKKFRVGCLLAFALQRLRDDRVVISSLITKLMVMLILTCALGDSVIAAKKDRKKKKDKAVAPVSYYVDSVRGSNKASGRSSSTPWADFTNINGKTLNPGDKLLIKRGSVINQELNIKAKGSAKAWIEIGPYGTGKRPTLRRNWDITESCAKIENASYLKISGLRFCYAGKGLLVMAGKEGHVTIEDCIAHHIEGIYRAEYNMSGIPQWKNFSTQGSWPPLSYGIAMVKGQKMVFRDCDIFQTTWGFFVAGGTGVTIDGVNVHDNYILNTSPHPSIAGLKDSVMKNCVFDAAGYHAAYGTMGIMVGEPENFSIQNSTFKNQPDSGSPDQGGIDFEANGDGVIVDRCTFENNAGYAIAVLGLNRPQPKNVTIQNSRFIQNSSRENRKPGEIYIFGHKNPQKKDPKVECSTGIIKGNGYVLKQGVQFFLDRSNPEWTDWKVRDNKAYESAAELKKAMPWNEPPEVEAGEGSYTNTSKVTLSGVVSDDRKAKGKRLRVEWEVLEGPGGVRFSKSSSAKTSATLSVPGDYMLRLKGHDGELFASDVVYVTRLEKGCSVVKGWEFNNSLDKEGWTEESLGETSWPDPTNPNFKTEEVKYVAGGYYNVAVKNATKATLISPQKLGIDARKNQVLEVRMLNQTNAKKMKLVFASEKSISFDVIPNDKKVRVYRTDLGKSTDWKGVIDQLQLELGSGMSATGVMRIDSVRLYEK